MIFTPTADRWNEQKKRGRERMLAALFWLGLAVFSVGIVIISHILLTEKDTLSSRVPSDTVFYLHFGRKDLQSAAIREFLRLPNDPAITEAAFIVREQNEGRNISTTTLYASNNVPNGVGTVGAEGMLREFTTLSTRPDILKGLAYSASVGSMYGYAVPTHLLLYDQDRAAAGEGEPLVFSLLLSPERFRLTAFPLSDSERFDSLLGHGDLPPAAPRGVFIDPNAAETLVTDGSDADPSSILFDSGFSSTGAGLQAAQVFRAGLNGLSSYNLYTDKAEPGVLGHFPGLTLEELESIIKEQLAILRPKAQSLSLPDGDAAQEYLYDPASFDQEGIPGMIERDGRGGSFFSNTLDKQPSFISELSPCSDVLTDKSLIIRDQELFFSGEMQTYFKNFKLKALYLSQSVDNSIHFCGY